MLKNGIRCVPNKRCYFLPSDVIKWPFSFSCIGSLTLCFKNAMQLANALSLGTNTGAKRTRVRLPQPRPFVEEFWQVVVPVTGEETTGRSHSTETGVQEYGDLLEQDSPKSVFSIEESKEPDEIHPKQCHHHKGIHTRRCHSLLQRHKNLLRLLIFLVVKKSNGFHALE